MEDIVLKRATHVAFWLLRGGFERDWNDGWRPALTPDGDILFLSKLGSYVRLKRSEQQGEPPFDLLHELLTTRGMIADRPNPWEDYRQPATHQV